MTPRSSQSADAAGCPALLDLAADVAWLRDLLANIPRLHRKDVLVRYGIGTSTLHRWIRAGRLPRPIRISGPLWR